MMTSLLNSNNAPLPVTRRLILTFDKRYVPFPFFVSLRLTKRPSNLLLHPNLDNKNANRAPINNKFSEFCEGINTTNT